MSSPFPGMDPYLEAFWRDVHASLVLYARDQLQPQFGGRFKARVEERLVIDREGEAVSYFYPDVRIVRLANRDSSTQPSGTAVAEPYVVEFEEQQTETYIKVVDAAGRVVTIVEFLSPANKVSADGFAEYQRKQREVTSEGINLVEIDLLRSGRRVFQGALNRLPKGADAPYFACVRRGHARRYEIYPIHLRTPLPTIRVPLGPDDADVSLDLQKLVRAAYDNGAYDDIDYRADPVPPLSDGDAAWADGLLRAAGKR